MYLDKTCFVDILTPYPSNISKEAFTAFSGFAGPGAIATSAIRMNIQPMSAQMTLLVEGVIGKTFLGFTSASGLTEGMRVTVSGTQQRFVVQGRQNYDYGPLQHSEVTLFKRDV